MELVPRPDAFVPGEAAEAAGELTEAYCQILQPEVAVAILTSLEPGPDGEPAELAVAEGVEPLAEYLGALCVYAWAAARLEPVAPGIVALPDGEVLVPYSVRESDTLDSIAAACGTTALAVAEASRDVPRVLAGERQVSVTVGDATHSAETGTGMSLGAAYEALSAQSGDVSFEAVVSAVAGTAGALRPGAPLVVPAPALAAGQAGAVMAADAAGAYGVGAAAFAAVNAALDGVVAPDVTLTGGDGTSVTTAEHDTLNGVLARLAEAGADLSLADLLRLNPDAALFRAGARVLLPPAPRAVSAALGNVAGPFPRPAFPLTVTLRIDGPAGRAESAALPQGELEPFVDRCLAALPDIRLATAPADNRAHALWAVDFGKHGIESVAVGPGLEHPDGTRVPRAFALRPLLRDLWSRAGVEVSMLDDQGRLGRPAGLDFKDIDVEAWARRFLADLDLFLSAPYAEGIQRVAAGELETLLAARERLAAAIAAGLAPVVQVPDAQAAPALASAIEHLRGLCATGLADGYGLTATVQYDAAVRSAYVGGSSAARLSGQACVRGDSAGYALGRAGTALDEASSFVELALRVTDSIQRAQALDFEYVYDAAQIEGERLDFVRPLTGTYRPSGVAELAATPTVPTPVRAHPAPPDVLGQTAGPTAAGPEPPSLEQAALWTYGVTYRHEHLEQDEVELTLAFDSAPPVAAAAAAGPSDALALALARYLSVAAPLGELMARYAEPSSDAPGSDPAASLATLAGAIATAWEAHWPAPDEPRAAPAASSYGLRLRYAPAALVVTRDSAEPGGWPDAFCRRADGSSLELTPGTPTATQLVYTFGEHVAAGPRPAIRLEWPGLNVASVESGHAALMATRNAGLVDGVATTPGFVLSTPPVETAGLATPLLEWRGEWELAGGDLAASLDAALEELFGTASGSSVTVNVSFEYAVAGSEIKTSIPVTVLPNLVLGSEIGTTVAAPVDEWRRLNPPEGPGAFVFALTVLSRLGEPPRPLFTLDGLVQPVDPA